MSYCGRYLALFCDRLGRIRFFRGHGVHSPFVYSIVRNVFMRRGLLPGRRDLYEAMLSAGIPSRRAAELQNLAIHCRYAAFDCSAAAPAVKESLCVALDGLPDAAILAAVRAGTESGQTVAIMSPWSDSARRELCRIIVSEHGSTTVDRRAYLLIFNNHLPKQHFRL